MNRELINAVESCFEPSDASPFRSSGLADERQDRDAFPPPPVLTDADEQRMYSAWLQRQSEKPLIDQLQESLDHEIQRLQAEQRAILASMRDDVYAAAEALKTVSAA